MNTPRPAVVLVDDEQPFVDFLAGMLRESLSCPVHTFTRPRAALAALPEIEAAVVVTDYWMPELDGFEFIREASQSYPKLRFIMISGHPLDLRTAEVGEFTPLRAILPKPFGWRTLADEILRHAPELNPSGARPPASRPIPHHGTLPACPPA